MGLLMAIVERFYGCTLQPVTTILAFYSLKTATELNMIPQDLNGDKV